MASNISVEVAYATADRQLILKTTVDSQASVKAVVRVSGILEAFPEIDLEQAQVGVFGKLLPNPDQYALCEGDRIEIYRPLIADPKAIRKKRAQTLAKKTKGDR